MEDFTTRFAKIPRHVLATHNDHNKSVTWVYDTNVESIEEATVIYDTTDAIRRIFDKRHVHITHVSHRRRSFDFDVTYPPANTDGLSNIGVISGRTFSMVKSHLLQEFLKEAAMPPVRIHIIKLPYCGQMPHFEDLKIMTEVIDRGLVIIYSTRSPYRIFTPGKDVSGADIGNTFDLIIDLNNPLGAAHDERRWTPIQDAEAPVTDYDLAYELESMFHRKIRYSKDSRSIAMGLDNYVNQVKSTLVSTHGSTAPFRVLLSMMTHCVPFIHEHSELMIRAIDAGTCVGIMDIAFFTSNKVESFLKRICPPEVLHVNSRFASVQKCVNNEK
jgi:hypothetical protein